tara:strand:- start:3757 stop:5958 length:2202 start_codon:yes stop_codon:yes gene_type:complete
VYKKYKILFANIIVLSVVLIMILIGYFINPKFDFFSFNKGNSVINDISSYCLKLKNSSNKYIGSNQKLLWQAKLNNAKDEYNIWFAKLGLAKAEMNLGGFDEAVSIIEEILNSGNFQSLPDTSKVMTYTSAALIYIKAAEVENCVIPGGSIVCQLPTDNNYKQRYKDYSYKAIDVLNEWLIIDSGNLKAKWLLNIAYMSIGEYPESINKALLIDVPGQNLSSTDKEFIDVSIDSGIYNVDLAGGVIFDDFNNDGYPDLITSTWDPCSSMKFYFNNGVNGFKDITEESNLFTQLGGLNIISTDYNNDGYLDIYVLRGGWLMEEGEMINSLLKNNGDMTFTDVTEDANLSDFAYPTQSASWGDYDNDGDLDLFICNESHIDENGNIIYPSQLFRNDDNKFFDVSSVASIQNGGYCKSSDWGDYNNDGLIDIFISNFGGENRLYKNLGNGLFKDVAKEAGVLDPFYSFTSWFWDYDNDDDLDIFSSGYEYGITKSIESFMGKTDSNYSLKLYENNGAGLYMDRTKDSGLFKVHSTMGANFADVNNDGYDDLYLGTGYPAIDSLVPNAFYINNQGLSFIDETHIYGLGHIQKGHGVAFADYDLDGDLDIFEQMGGFYLSDGFTNILYQNSNNINNWIGIKLIGSESNKIAFGAKINLICNNKNYNIVVDPGGSFGSSSLIKVMGIQDCKNIDKLYITWPKDKNIQEINNISVNQYILVKETEIGYKKIKFKVGKKIE